MIGGTFEYLVSSLPYLSFQNTDEVKLQVLDLLQKYAGSGAEEFSAVEIVDQEVQKFLPASTFSIFRKIKLENIHLKEFQKSKIKVIADFSKFVFELKKDLKIWRSSEGEPDHKLTKSRLGNILGDGSPLEKEIKIMHLQWTELEELGAMHFSDFSTLVIYKMKLMLLLRWWSFDMEKGIENFTQITTEN